MSTAFEIFISEYNAKGQEKLNGYSIVNLRNLSAEEKKKAIAILRNDVLNNLHGVDALSFLDINIAISTLKEVESKKSTERNRYIYEVYYWQWMLDKKENYAENFIQSFQSTPENIKRIFYSLAKKMIESITVEKFIRSSFFFETDKNCIGTAAASILNKHGFSGENPATKEKFIEMWKTLTEGTIDQKKVVLAELPPFATA